MTCPTLKRAMEVMPANQRDAFLAEIGKQARYEGHRQAWGEAVNGGTLTHTQAGKARTWR